MICLRSHGEIDLLHDWNRNLSGFKVSVLSTFTSCPWGFKGSSPQLVLTYGTSLLLVSTFVISHLKCKWWSFVFHKSTLFNCNPVFHCKWVTGAPCVLTFILQQVCKSLWVVPQTWWLWGYAAWWKSTCVLKIQLHYTSANLLTRETLA